MSRMKKFFTLFLIFVLFPAIQTMAGGTYHLKVGDSQRVSFTPHDGILTHTIRWVSYSASIDVSEYIGTTATIKVLAPIDVSRVIVRCEYEYIRYIGNFPRYFSAVEDFTIYVDPSDPTDITLQSSLTLNVGDFATLTPTLYPSGAETQLSWSSSNSSVASVSASGKVFGGEAGSANITVRTSNGLSATCRVTVRNPVLPSDPTNITLQSSLTLNVGDFATLTPTLYPSGAETQLSWSSSNSSVASVSASGKVFGGEAGSANITVRTSNGLSATCRVTVKNPVLSLRINPAAGLLEKGSSVTLTAGSNNADIYYTLDGSVPTRSSLVYSSPIPIDRNVTLKAIAYCDGYTQSSVVTADYTVTSLKTVGCYPENNTENINRNAIPSITFNSEISESDKWNDIKLKDGLTEISGKTIISGNTLYFVPNEPLEYNKSYTFTLPVDAVKTGLNEPNFSYLSVFTMIMDDVLSVSAGDCHTMAIKTDGNLWSCGDNSSGQLGDGTESDRYSFVKVMDDVLSVSAGYYHTMAIKTDGSLWAWGDNFYEQLGNGTTTHSDSPVKIMDDVLSVSAGRYSTIVIKSDNSLWAWGYNLNGELGDGTTTHRDLPVKIMDDVAFASIGYCHTTAIKTDGSLWAWGDNQVGQLGDGTTTERHSPVKVMDDVLSVSAGRFHTVAIKADGSLWSWGRNSSGQLGDGTTTERHSPIKIMEDVLSVSAGDNYTMAIKTDGSLWSWGRNSSGQLGDGTTTDRHSPIKVVEGTSPIQSIDFDKEKIELRIGSKSVLQTYLQPFNAEYENILWNSTNENVATVSPKGVITAVAPGTTTITATVETEKGADCSASCIVTVSDVSGINAVPYNPLSAWIDNGMLHIKGLKPGNIFSIYDVMGKPVYRGTAESTEINRPIEGKGIFIVKTENCAVKVININ